MTKALATPTAWIKKKEPTLKIQIPFEGFYESRYSGLIDFLAETETSEIENPEDACEAAEKFYESFNTRGAFEYLAREYAKAFFSKLKEETGINFPAPENIELHSPREYNFQTDSVSCEINQNALEKLINQATLENYSGLAEFIQVTMAPRDGFIPFYSNDLEAWRIGEPQNLEPVQLELLLEGIIETSVDVDNDFYDDVFDAVHEQAICNGGLYEFIG